MALNANTLSIINYLKENKGEKILAADIAEELGLTVPQVTGSVNALQKKGLTKREPGKIKLEDDTTKAVKFISLTDDGLAFSPASAE